MSKFDLLAELEKWWKSWRSKSQTPNRLADVATDDDKLGYTEFAEAIAAKIVDAVDDGGTPFTIGIHGAWGSGKTSFLKLIEKELKKQSVKPIWFNAWKYNEEDNLWSAMLQRVLDEAPLNYPWYKRPFIKLRLWVENIDWRASGIELSAKFLLLVIRLLLVFVGAGIGLGVLTEKGTQTLTDWASRFFANNPAILALIQNKAAGWVSLFVAFIAADPKKSFGFVLRQFGAGHFKI
jgi:hypothetical protein